MARLPVPVLGLLLLSLALALVAMATWLEGKPLWTAYNAIGALVGLLLALVVARANVPIPRAAALVCFASVMLHYVGGSLGGHFGIEGINGLYAVFPWWDRVTHFAGSTGVAILAFHLLAQARAQGWRLPDAAIATFALSLSVVVGVLVELFEFAAWTFFGTVDQGFYSNTMMDLLDDLAGAAFGAGVALALRPAARGAARPAEGSDAGAAAADAAQP